MARTLCPHLGGEKIDDVIWALTERRGITSQLDAAAKHSPNPRAENVGMDTKLKKRGLIFEAEKCSDRKGCLPGKSNRERECYTRM
jgi:hypothetical protein